MADDNSNTLANHEERLSKLEEAVKVSTSGTTLRLDLIESTQRKHGEALGKLTKETSEQTAELGTIKGDVSRLGRAVRGDEVEEGKGGIVGDLALVKRAVVKTPAQVGGMLLYRSLVAGAIIIGGLVILAIFFRFPQFIPLLEEGLKQLLFGKNH
jgi:hypothetical protein